MGVILAERTFMGLQADAWSAIGVWVTIGISLLVARFAYGQVKEAQTLRHEQTRPFVVADIFTRDIIAFFMVKNIGTTPAYNLRVELAERLESTGGRSTDWQDSTAFTTGVPTVPPGFMLRFFLDSMPSRLESDLPTIIRGTLHYDDILGQDYHEPFVIDLTVYKHSLIAEKTMHELVREAEQIRKDVHRATDQMVRWSRSYEGIHVAPVEPLPDDEDDT